MSLIMIALMILRIYSSTESGIQVSHYGVPYHPIIQVSLVIHSVQAAIVQLLRLRICLYRRLIAFILMSLGSMQIVGRNKVSIISVSLERAVILIPLETSVIIIPLETIVG